jgi:hypothetical protein
MSVFLKDMNDIRNFINVNNVGILSPFTIISFEMTQFTLDFNAVHVHNLAKASLDTFQCCSKTEN